MTTPTPLTQAELADFLAVHPEWSVRSGKLTRTFQRPSFPAAIAFVQRVADIAEAHGHHPDMDIRYRDVTLAVNTHDAGNALTEKDLRLATACDAAADNA
jgi:4a-hydroxytetrahydrobiopterin dehydratase